MKTHTIKNNDRLDTLKELSETIKKQTEWVTVSIINFFDQVDETFTCVICYHE